MRKFLALCFLLAFCVGSLAEIRPGAEMQVKANSIWFEDAAQLKEWQRRKKSGDAKAFAAYQDRLIRRREDWQFVNPLTVKILCYDRRRRHVKVEMATERRFRGSTWFLDAAAIEQ